MSAIAAAPKVIRSSLAQSLRTTLIGPRPSKLVKLALTGPRPSRLVKLAFLDNPALESRTSLLQHAALRFVHRVPPLASYNQKYLRTRIDMHRLAALNKQSKNSLLAAEGIIKMAHSRRRVLRQLQLRAYNDMQLLPCLSLFCTCHLCLELGSSCRLTTGCKCPQCSLFYESEYGMRQRHLFTSVYLARPHLMCTHTRRIQM